jgi:hypothetical protein
LIRRILTVVGAVVLILISRPVYRLGVGLGFWQPFTRPPDVSSRARYVVTMEDSAWFDCSFDPGRDVDVCRAWDEAGHLIAHGNYRLDGERGAARPTELRPSEVAIYPGRPELAWIYLEGDHDTRDKTLVPVNETGEPLERFDVHIQDGSERR